MSVNLLTLLQTRGLFLAVPLAFIAIGCFMLVRAVWGLLTGGPRAVQAPGAPYLYDRLYWLLNLVMLIGWTGFAVCFLAGIAGGMTGDNMLIFMCWAICAIGIGLMFLLRGEMMLDGQRYLARHGFYLWRWGRSLQVARMEQQAAWLRNLVAGVFVVIGVVILGVCIAQFPRVAQEFRDTGDAIVHIFAE